VEEEKYTKLRFIRRG